MSSTKRITTPHEVTICEPSGRVVTVGIHSDGDVVVECKRATGVVDYARIYAAGYWAHAWRWLDEQGQIIDLPDLAEVVHECIVWADRNHPEWSSDS